MINLAIYIWLPSTIIISLLLITLILSYICFKIIFYSKNEEFKEKYPLPPGREYEVYKDDIIDYMIKTDKLNGMEVTIKSFDGLTLKGKYYECEKGAPIELMIHGYRGDARRDLSGGVVRAFKHKRNVLLVDNRGSGKSEGHVITFGVNESKDTLRWIDYIINNINKDAQIILTGVSMGAATVLILSSLDLPKNVIGVIADCGYTSTKEIIKKVIKDLKLPPRILYPFVYLGARLFGKFKPDEVSPIKAMENSKLPIIFFHGDADSFVPYYMSIENYNKCVSKKHMVNIPGAGHGLCYVKDPEKYLLELENFFN